MDDQKRESRLARKRWKEKRAETYKIAASRKSDLYENCKMIAPDGQLLSTCDRKKVNWYISRGLAELIEDTENKDDVTMRLKFEVKKSDNISIRSLRFA